MASKENWKQKYYEEIEEVNLRADMVCARNDELEKENEKLENMLIKFDNDHFQYYLDCMKVVNFFKDNLNMKMGDYHDGTYFVILEGKEPTYFDGIVIRITEEQKKLLKDFFGKDNLIEIGSNSSI